MTTWNIVESELIEWLQAYDGPRFHAVLSDPPYALISITKRFGKDGSVPTHGGSDGRYTRLSSGFMGQKWDGFDSLEHYQTWVSEWAKLLIEKALYPGAVCMFFGGTRTFHHLGVGLERGGFEIVDSILIPWLHGQGFPKSHDISKGLDKAADAKRETIGTNPNVQGRESGGIWAENITRPWKDRARAGDKSGSAVTKPATEDAETWDGYGTALKPAWEPVYVCRAPRGDMTFAELAVQYGTGALNIDGSRIMGAKTVPSSPRQERDGSSGIYGRFGPDSEKNSGSDPGVGRWPANLVLTHHKACVKVGEYETKGRTLNRYPSHGMGGSFAFYAEDHRGEEYESEKLPSEIVERWACVPGCPVRELDDQVGHLHGRGDAPKGAPSYSGPVDNMFGSGTNKFAGSTGVSDTIGGGPSRFFYTAKASRSEKDQGLEHFWWKRTDEGFERISEEAYGKLDKRSRARGCVHPTVKPLDLLRYLSTLLLPPKQEGKTRRILVPFSGSGSEMIGAVQAGWNEVTGIEMEQNYIEMAEARLTANIGMF